MKQHLQGKPKSARTQRRASRVRLFLHLLSFLFLLSSLLLPPLSFASAQGAAYVEIGAPDISAFPKITTVLDVYDADGQFVSGLKPADVIMREDRNARPAQELTEFPVGAQIVVGVNPGPALGVRDGSGITRYQRVQTALQNWAKSLPSEPADDLSLVTIAGPVSAHTGPSAWVAAFSAFQPDFHSTTTNIQSLAFALDAALAPTPQLGMKRAVLFITSHMDDPNLEAALTPMGQRALAGRVRIFVWYVDGQPYFDHPSAKLFQTLATQTGGSFATFDGSVKLPDLETYFTPLRSVYRVTYESVLKTAGDHSLSTEVKVNGVGIASAAQTFTLNVQPPNPILAEPPPQVTRAPPADDPYNEKILEPSTQNLRVIFDFPDGHRRPIVSVTLYVDDQPVAKNTTGALDQFTWDLSSYTETGTHQLRVEATDSLGLTGSSIETPVIVQVVHPPSTPLIFLARYRYILVGIVVAVAGVILLGVLLGGRLRIRSRRERREQKQRYTDPVTQPISIAATEPPTGPKKATRKTKTIPAVEAPASLIRLTPDGQPASAAPIPLLGIETTIGIDPVQASVVLDEPVLSPLHTRILRTEAGYSIFDPGSAAGTWVNYERVTREGHPLKHGDRVHLGHLMYRFEMKNPPAIPEPTVTPIDS